jgi:hypothetical protein
MRLSCFGLLACLLVLSSCHSYHSGYHFSVSVNTEAAPSPTFTGLETNLSASYSTDNVAVYLTDHNWTVLTAAGPYVLQDNGFTAKFTPSVAGDYTIRYRAWYYTNYDYCCYATSYRESIVVVTALVPPPG